MSVWLNYHSKAFAAALLALVCAGLGFWLLTTSASPGATFSRASYDSYYRWFGLADGAPTNGPVMLVYLDLESHLRERQDPAKPWPRSLHAQLLRRLKAAGK